MSKALKEEAENWLRDYDRFAAESEGAGYTDSADLWYYAEDARELLAKFIASVPSSGSARRQDLARSARAWTKEINEFERQSTKETYTDVGDLWGYTDDARKLLEQLAD